MNTRWLKWALKKYAPDILTGMATGGVVLTGYLSAEAGKKSTMDILYNKFWLTDKISIEREELEHLGKKEELKLTWKNYIPAAVAGAGTIACSIGAHKTHLHNEAVLAAIAALYSGKYRDLERKAKELLGDKKFGELRTQLAADEVAKNRDTIPISTDENAQTYFEPYSSQYFTATPHEMLYAQLHINQIFQEYGGVTLNDYLNVLPGCHRVDIGSDIGWYQGTDDWEEIWGWFNDGPGHFIDITFDDLPGEPNVKSIEYNVAPAPADDNWEPFR